MHYIIRNSLTNRARHDEKSFFLKIITRYKRPTMMLFQGANFPQVAHHLASTTAPYLVKPVTMVGNGILVSLRKLSHHLNTIYIW